MAKTFNLLVTFLILFVLTGCGSQPSTGYVMPQQINEPVTSLLPPEFEQQTEVVNNCDGASPSYTVRYKTVETQNATFEVVVEAGGLVTGTPIPAALEVQLEAKLATSLSKQYGITVEREHELPLVIPNGKKVQHIITWKVIRVKGLFDVLYNNGTAQVAFSRIASVELADRQSEELSCAEGAMLFTPQDLTAVPQDISTDTVVVIGTTPPPSPRPATNSGVVTQLDSILGIDNWFCFPDRGDAVGVKKLPEVTVQSPLVKVDTYFGTFTSGKTPYGIGATAWLNTWFPQEECPTSQTTGLAAWKAARIADNSQFNRSRLDSLFGTGNWQCVSGYAYAAKVNNLPAGTLIQYPFTAVDNSSGKYGVGETMSQSDSATVWLAGSISDCQ